MPIEDITILSTAEWNNPFWTNKQHVAVQLANMGHRVLHIDSLGLRAPTATRQDALRIVDRLARLVRGPEQVRERLWVWSPFSIPMQQYGVVRRVNRMILGMGLPGTLAEIGFSPDILWTYNPLTTQLIDTARFERLVYHCVDEISAQPGMPARRVTEAEEELTRTADVVFTTSPALTDTRRKWNRNTHYFSNVADFDHFSSALDPSTEIPADLRTIPGPRIGFIGAVADYKVDTDLLASLAATRPDWSIVIIGKVGEGEPSTSVRSLKAHRNVHLMGPRDYRTLPAYLRGFDVAMLPNRINEYTASMFPMKFFEYLAAGRPVVTTALPAVREHRDVVEYTSSFEEFVCGIERCLDGKGASLDARLSRARMHTYASRMEHMMATYRDTVEPIET